MRGILAGRERKKEREREKETERERERVNENIKYFVSSNRNQTRSTTHHDRLRYYICILTEKKLNYIV